MKKHGFIILVLLSFLIMVVWVGKDPRDEYTLPINEKDVDSVTIYYENVAAAKNISSEPDVLAVIDTLDDLLLGKNYEMTPTGGLLFYIIFHLEDGTEWICTFYESGTDAGYFADGNVRKKVSNLNVLELWKSLDYPEIKGFSIEEFAVPVL